VLYICENWFHVEHLGLESSLMRLAASSLFSILYLYFVVMSFLNLSEHWAGLFVLPLSLYFGSFNSILVYPKKQSVQNNFIYVMKALPFFVQMTFI